MIVATAGHIDHGKTSLVRALTGVDADRLPEEKRRGITIDLGFAYLKRPDGGTIGFVDVPGHERLVRTMMAGASGVDLALLVVAADDGVMPQTREHLAVLDLLGVGRGLVALTKSDRVGPARLAEVAAQITGALASTALAGAPVMPCSSLSGAGIDVIAGRLEAEAGATARRNVTGRFRLAVDRAFTLAGVGVVVTGSVHAGHVAVGDRVLISPGGIEARVRGLHAQNEAATVGAAGQRVALNIAGARVDKDAIRRGDWVLAPELHRPTDRLDVRVRLLPSETAALKDRSSVHVHLGAASVVGQLILLGGGSLAPGGSALAQLALAAPVGALWGDRFALRDAAAQRTIGGGRVLDPFAVPRRGRSPGHAPVLAALEHDDPVDALAAAMAAQPAGVDLDRFAVARNLADPTPLLAACVVADRLAFAPGHWQALGETLVAALATHHAEHADTWGMTLLEFSQALDIPLRPAAASLARTLTEAGRVQRTGLLLHRPGHEVRLVPADAARWAQVGAALAAAGLDPPRLTTLTERVGVAAETLQPLLDKLARLGWLCRVSPAYVLLPGTVTQLTEQVVRLATESEERLLTVGRFREATGMSRHATMPVLEYLDRIGVTRRVREGREVCADLSAYIPTGGD